MTLGGASDVTLDSEAEFDNIPFDIYALRHWEPCDDSNGADPLPYAELTSALWIAA